MQLHIPIEIWQKMRAYATLSSPNEITGIGTIKVLGPENLWVTEIFLPKQTVSRAECAFAEDALNEIIADLAEKSPERLSELRFRWHSHAESGVFWSGKDERDIESWESVWCINLVINANNDYLARLDYFSPLRIRNHPVTIVVEAAISAEERIKCVRDINDKVTEVPIFGTVRKEP